MEKFLVSIIIPTISARKKQLNNLIASINKSSYQNIEKIIIADKGKGLACNRNLGAQKAHGKYLLFIDDDNIIHPLMIERLTSEMEDNSQLAGIGPITYYKDYPNKIWFLSVRYNFTTSIPRFDKKIENKKITKNLYPTQNLHNCFMVKKSLGDKIGWFDKRMYIFGVELDFFTRINRKYADLQLATHLKAWCYHQIPVFSYNNLRSMGLYHKKGVYYLQKNRAVLIKRYAKSYQIILFSIFFYPLLTILYFFFYLIKKRVNYLSPLLKGTIAGYQKLKSWEK